MWLLVMDLLLLTKRALVLGAEFIGKGEYAVTSPMHKSLGRLRLMSIKHFAERN